MTAKKIIKPTDQATNSTQEAIKSITDLNNLEMDRKKKVDPIVE
ncbi:hypothetical protein [Algoriphagus aquimarinus]|tara:strand:- start:4540 stop:4671 length:132 start_codon:yes stop_codon:yes gene_type:complete